MRTIATVLVAISLGPWQLAALAQGQGDSLRGIGPVLVTIDAAIPEHVEMSGFTDGMLTTAIRLRLRSHGVPLDDDQGEAFGRMEAVVSVFEDKDMSGLLAFTCKVEFVQPVFTIRNEGLVPASTWRSQTWVGMVGIANVMSVRDFILSGVDEFANDYLTVNPQ